MSSLKKIAKGGALLLAGDGLSVLWSYAFLLLASRLLGPDLLGAYYWAVAIITLLAHVAMIGLPQALNYFVPRYEARQVNSSRNLLIFTTLVVALSAGSLALLLFIFAPQVCRSFQRPGLVSLLRLFSFALPSIALWPLLSRYMIARLDVLPSVIIEDVLKGAVRILVLLAILALGVKYFALVGADLGVALVIAALALIYISRRYGFGNPGLIDQAKKKRVLFYSLSFVGFYMFRLDSMFSMLLAYFLDMSDVAVFNVALRIALLGNFLYMALITMFSPITSKLIAENKWQELRRNYRSITRWLIIGSLPLFFLTVMYPAAWLGLFGPEFTVGSVCLVILAVGLFYNYATSVNSTIITMSGRAWLNLGYFFMQALLALAVGLLLVPRYGLNGGALAFAVGTIFVNSIRLYRAWRIVGAGPYSWYLLKPLAAAALASLLVGLFFPIGSLLTFGRLAVAALVYLTVYGALILLLGITKEDKEMLKEAYVKFRPEWLGSQMQND